MHRRKPLEVSRVNEKQIFKQISAHTRLLPVPGKWHSGTQTSILWPVVFLNAAYFVGLLFGCLLTGYAMCAYPMDL